MGEVVNLPLDRITERDRTRLFRAAATSPLDIDLVTDEDGVPCVLVYRCGWAHPSFRIEKAEGVWHAYDLEHGEGGIPMSSSRLPADLISQISAIAPRRGRPTTA